MNTRRSQPNKSILKNQMDRLALLSGASISKGEISSRTNNSIKGNGLDRKLVQRKDTTPGQANKEVEKLAKAWCELLLNQMQEAQLTGIDRCH